MIKWYLAILTCAFIVDGGLSSELPKEATGTWRGSVAFPGLAIEVQVHLHKVGTKLSGTIDIPCTRSFALPLDDVSQRGTKAYFSGKIRVGETEGKFEWARSERSRDDQRQSSIEWKPRERKSWPTDHWPEGTLATHEIDETRLKRAVQHLEGDNRHLRAVLVVRGGELVFELVEPTLLRFVHACTVDDLAGILESVPARDWMGLTTFVLRQPTHKERVLRPVWGRLAYSANLGRHSGPTVFLEAQRPTDVHRWGRRLRPEDASELERLRNEGHRITEDKRSYSIHSSLAAIRTTQLYRTLLHEIGHWVHYHQEVRQAEQSCRPDEMMKIEYAFWARAHREREGFAERYATAIRMELERRGRVPFDRRFDATRLGRDGLRKAWFGI